MSKQCQTAGATLQAAEKKMMDAHTGDVIFQAGKTNNNDPCTYIYVVSPVLLTAFRDRFLTVSSIRVQCSMW